MKANKSSGEEQQGLNQGLFSQSRRQREHTERLGLENINMRA